MSKLDQNALCTEAGCGHVRASHFSSEMGSFCRECPLERNQWEHLFTEYVSTRKIMMQGELVRVCCEKQEVLAVIALISPNGKSLVLRLADDYALHLPNGGMYLRNIPVRLDDDGHYRGLIESVELRIVPIKLLFT